MNPLKCMNPINQIYESNPNQIYESKSNESITESFNSFYISHLLLCISFYYYLFIFMIHQNVAFHIITNTYECILYCFVVVCVYLMPSVLLCVCLLQLGIHICMRKSNPTKNPGRVVHIKICCD